MSPRGKVTLIQNHWAKAKIGPLGVITGNKMQLRKDTMSLVPHEAAHCVLNVCPGWNLLRAEYLTCSWKSKMTFPTCHAFKLTVIGFPDFLHPLLTKEGFLFGPGFSKEKTSSGVCLSVWEENNLRNWLTILWKLGESKQPQSNLAAGDSGRSYSSSSKVVAGRVPSRSMETDLWLTKDYMWHIHIMEDNCFIQKSKYLGLVLCSGLIHVTLASYRDTSSHSRCSTSNLVCC